MYRVVMILISMGINQVARELVDLQFKLHPKLGAFHKLLHEIYSLMKNH